MTTLEEDPQIDALVRASGHTRDDAIHILNELNKIGWSVRPVTGLLASIPSFHQRAVRRSLSVEVSLPTYEQCEVKVDAKEATELERFIYNNEPSGIADDDWRASLADLLAETIEEDRVAGRLAR